jgi:1,4-dihydroxy-2-naphthoate polyprenyltransferase
MTSSPVEWRSPKSISLESSITSRWQALNPAIYLISILPGLAVILLAGQQSGWYYGLSLATFAVVLLQHAINVFNDLSDWRLGADVNKMDSWVRFHQQDMRAVALHGTISFLAGMLLGLYVLHISSQYWLLAIAAPLVVLGYLYNSGSKPLSYSSAGEWVTGVCYGPGVFGCLWLVSGHSVDTIYVLGSVAFAALSLSLLLSHQPPQIETDRQAGKHSFAARNGARKTYTVARLMLVISCLSIALGLYRGTPGYTALTAYSLASALLVIAIYKVKPQPKIIMLGSSLAISTALIVSATID